MPHLDYHHVLTGVNFFRRVQYRLFRQKMYRPREYPIGAPPLAISEDLKMIEFYADVKDEGLISMLVKVCLTQLMGLFIVLEFCFINIRLAVGSNWTVRQIPYQGVVKAGIPAISDAIVLPVIQVYP